MKIKSIYISAFGSLKDFSLDLTDGLQIIYGENEAGKTTVCEFIKAMFYGSRRTAGMTMSAREKYAPFDGSPAGGRITFQKDGGEFVLERQFRKSDATDKVTLTDLATGKSEAVAADIGKELFGISMPAFERSVFIGNSPAFLSDENAQGEINQKLADTALAAEDGVSYKKVLNRIDTARLKLISKSGKTGSLINDIQNCNSLIETLEETDRAAHRKQEMVTALRETEDKLKKITAELEKEQAVLDSAKDIQNTNKLKEYLELKESLDKLTRELTLPDGTVADEMFIKKFEFGFSKLENLRQKAENTAEELKRLNEAAADRKSATVEELRERIKAENSRAEALSKKTAEKQAEIEETELEAENLKRELENAKTAKKPFNLLLLILGVLIIVSGAGLYLPIKSIALSCGICAAGIAMLALSFIIRPRDLAAQSKIETALELKLAALSSKNAEFTALGGEAGNIDSRIENLTVALNFGVNDENRIKDTAERLKSEQALLSGETVKTLKFFGLPEDIDTNALKEQISGLSGKADEQKQIKLRLSYLSRDLGGISYEQAKEKLETSKNNDAVFDIEKQKQTVKALSDAKSDLQTAKARLETELKTGFQNLENPEDLRREITEIKERIAEKQAFYDAANVAYSVLEESFIAARQSFGSTLENETLKNLKALTVGSYKAVNISKDFEITAERTDSFGMHNVEYLSRGTKDQAYLALRLAVSKLISEKEPLPIVLDDSLSQYDDKRFLSSLDFLREYAENSQICLFTCHDFVKAAAEKNGIKTVELKKTETRDF